MDPDETGPYLFAPVGLEVQSDRVSTCLVVDQVARTLGLEVIKEFQPVIVAPCLVGHNPFVQFFLREGRSWTRSLRADSMLAKELTCPPKTDPQVMLE